MLIRSQMSSIMEQIKPEHPELVALEFGKTAEIALKFGKIAETDFVYTLASPNINQSAPNLVKMYVTIRSRMSSIMGQVIPDQWVFSVFEIENMNFSSLFGIYLHC